MRLNKERERQDKDRQQIQERQEKEKQMEQEKIRAFELEKIQLENEIKVKTEAARAETEAAKETERMRLLAEACTRLRKKGVTPRLTNLNWKLRLWSTGRVPAEWKEGITCRLLLLTDVIHYLVTSVAYRRTHLLRRHCNCQ